MDFEKILCHKYGIYDQETYKKYVDTKSDEGITLQEIELLSPDNIDNRAFWNFISKKYGVDPIVQTEYGKINPSISEGNFRNLRIPLRFGMLGWVEFFAPYCKSIAEIGAGYGCFQQWMAEKYPYIKYDGYDVDPKLPNIIQATKEGLFPDPDKKYDIIFSSNVFQHLNQNQRFAYYKMCSEMSPILMVMFCTKSSSLRKYRCHENGKDYFGHYSQYIEAPDIQTEINELSKYFKIDTIVQHYGDVAILCIK